MRRREFIVGLGGAWVWPVVSPGQPPERVRRMGVLTGLAGDDAETRGRVDALLYELQRLGWTESNLRIDLRGAGGNVALARQQAAALVALEPDIILAIGNLPLPPLLELTRTIPIVFAIVLDPVGSGFVKSLSRPGGNVTGFMMFDYSLSGKWPELLKQIAPGVTQAAVVREPTFAGGIGQFAVIQAVAPLLGLEVTAVDGTDEREIERDLEAFAHSTNGGLIVTGGPSIIGHRKLLVSLAARYKMPAVYIERLFVKEGGLLSYGPNFVEMTRRTAGYIDRILKGERPADLPVQAPDKYDLIINLKTAKALGLEVPQSLLARADEVIE